MTEHHEEPIMKDNILVVMSVGILIVFLVLVFGVYKWVSGKKGAVVFPAGLNYTGGENSQQTKSNARPNYDWAKMVAAADWKSFQSPLKQYKFQHPGELIPLIFPGDVNDSVTFDVSDIPVQFNLMVTVEAISYYDSDMVGSHEEFVRNYWRFFSGLASLAAIESFQNEKGLLGYKVTYNTKGTGGTREGYFLIIPGQDDKIIHITNIFPKEAESLFMRILNSLEYIK